MPPARDRTGATDVADDGEAGSDPAARREPVGAPVVRGDPEITGEHARGAAQFDPDAPESLERAVETAREFAAEIGEVRDRLTMLRGAAACAALVRGTGSYAAAADRAGEPVSVSFLRKWARVHDLPISVRKHIARGDIPPSAATHIASVTGRARFLLAWAVIDHDLSVEAVGQLASDIKGGTAIETAFRDRDLDLGTMEIALSLPVYRELRRHASLRNDDPEAVVELALRRLFESESES